MSKEYIAALKEERDFYKAKSKHLQNDFNKSDAGIAQRLREWVDYHTTPELHRDYPSLGFYVKEMRKVLNE